MLAGGARQARISWRPAISLRYKGSIAGRRGEAGEDLLEARRPLNPDSDPDPKHCQEGQEVCIFFSNHLVVERANKMFRKTTQLPGFVYRILVWEEADVGPGGGRLLLSPPLRAHTNILVLATTEGLRHRPGGCLWRCLCWPAGALLNAKLQTVRETWVIFPYSTAVFRIWIRIHTVKKD